MTHAHDILPQSAGLSALVRRITFRLNAELHFRGHKPLTDAERAALFNLGDASQILDGVAILPGMAQHEERARRDLLELYSIFNQESITPLPLDAYKVFVDFARAGTEALGVEVDLNLRGSQR